MTLLTELTITEALAKLRLKEITSVELTRAYLDQIEKLDPTLQAYLTVTVERALADAEAADKARAAGDERPLLGIPLAIKDVLSTKDIETTCGSKILKGYKPLYDATVVQRLADLRYGAARQGQHGRVRDGFVHRKLGLCHYP